MGLFQVLKASETDIVLFTLMDCSVCYSLLLATSVLITRNGTKAKCSCLVSGSHPSALILQLLRDVQLHCSCGFVFELR